MNLGQTIRHGVKWSFFGNTGTHILQFAFGIVMARLLMPADFGAMATIQVFTGFVGLLAAGGLGQSLIRAKEATAGDFHAVFTMQLVVGMAIYAGFYVAAPMVAAYFNEPLYADLLRVVAITFIIRPFASIRLAWLSRAMEYKKRSVIDLAVALLVGFSSIAMALAGLGVWSLVFAGMIGALATNVLLSLIVPLRPKLRWHLATVRQHASYGVKLTVNELLTYFKEQAVYLVVSKNAGAEALGLLTRGESLARMPNRFVTPPVGRVVFRAMSKVQDDLDQSKYLFYRTITLLTAYVGPLLVIFIWVAEPLVLTVYGAKWLPAAGPAQILAVAGFFLVLGRPASVLLEARNRLNQEMVVQAVTLVVAVGGSLFGLRWGLTGAAWAIVSAHIFSATCLYMLAHRTVRASARDMTRAVSPAIVLNGLLAATLGVLHFALADLRTNAPAAYLLVMAACGGLVYAMAFLFLPLEALRSEADRWKRLITSTLKRAGR